MRTNNTRTINSNWYDAFTLYVDNTEKPAGVPGAILKILFCAGRARPGQPGMSTSMY